MRNGSEDGTDDTMVDEVHQYQKLTCQKRWVQLDETKNKNKKLFSRPCVYVVCTRARVYVQKIPG